MLRDLWQKNRLDALLILLVAVLTLAGAVLFHAESKPLARLVAFVGPVVFAASLMTLIAAMSLAKRFPAAARARRILIDIAIGAVVLAVALSKAELAYAPFAALRAEAPAAVVARIAADNNVARYQAWARIATLSRDEKDEVARGLAELLLGSDDAARRSATLTLEQPLRRHTLTALLRMEPELRAFLDAKAAALPPTPPAARAGAFTASFVETSYKAILKALSPKSRAQLPTGGIDVLFLALASNEPIGRLFLRGFAEEGDDLLKSKAQTTLARLVPSPTT